MKGAEVTAILTKLYRALRYPPQESLAYQVAYLILAAGAALSASVHNLGQVDTILARREYGHGWRVRDVEAASSRERGTALHREYG